jgi:hypothetical protein
MAMAAKSSPAIAVIGIDIGKNAFHVVGLDERGAIVLRRRWSRGQKMRLFQHLWRPPEKMEQKSSDRLQSP